MIRFVGSLVEVLVFSTVMVVCTAAVVFAIRPGLLVAVLVYLSGIFSVS